VLEFFGQTRIYTGGYEQTGPYVTHLWRDALAHLSSDHPITHILVVGLGGGGSIQYIQKKFVKATLTCIEWDPVMVAIAKKLHLYNNEPTILIGDVFEIIPHYQKQFDLILFDAFFGATPEPRLEDIGFCLLIRNALSPTGKLIINVSRTTSLISTLSKCMLLNETWTYKNNTLALFSKTENT
jgi:spermidine synthase